MFKVPEEFRMNHCGAYSSDASYGNNGAFLIKTEALRRPLFIIAGDGGGWEHVSVTVKGAKRCPKWEEMCFIKSLFWGPDDLVIQYHPAAKDYINMMDHCLHLWRPHHEVVPVPPKAFVGFK